MIFVRNQTISGLTTAAGVWATAGIGMTIGAGLYFLGVAATLLIVSGPDDAPQKLYMAQLPRGRADLEWKSRIRGTVSPPSGTSS